MRIGVLISGSGTNLQADHRRDRARRARRARRRRHLEQGGGVRARACAQARHRRGLHRPRATSTRAAVQRTPSATSCVAHDVDLVVMAGYMRLLGQRGARRVSRCAVVNLHPALLPSFPGANGIQRRVRLRREGHRRHGALRQRGLRRGPDHRPGGRAHRRGRHASSRSRRRSTRSSTGCYPAALQLIAEGRVRVEGRKVRIGVGARSGHPHRHRTRAARRAQRLHPAAGARAGAAVRRRVARRAVEPAGRVVGDRPDRGAAR